ncbi:MAG: hypothetical protein MRZ79_15640 [Bacteroidia bacterium]|nr:hypothetical protein [Bacteroidia bacterium]
MKKIVLIGLSLLFLISCEESPETKFSHDGVSFLSPKGWKITEQETIEDGGYYLSVKRDGLNSGGLLTITWFDGEVELDYLLEQYKTNLQENYRKLNTTLNFSEAQAKTFNKIDCSSIEYNTTYLASKVLGEIIGFYHNGKTFCVLKQDLAKDVEKSRKGFAIIENSFVVEILEIVPEASQP